MKFSGVNVGAGVLEFYWASTGKTASWIFSPSITNPKPALISESRGDDGKSQIVNVELGNLLLPASGIMRTDLTGEFWAHAVQFDLPHAYDLWVFILRSPSFPMKVVSEKSELNIAHNLAQATAQISSLNISANSSQLLRADVSVHGEGFKNVSLSLKRSVNRVSAEETLGIINGPVGGSETFTWKPVERSFNVVLMAYSNLGRAAFFDFLKFMGAETRNWSDSPTKDFLLAEGGNVRYSLKLSGETHIFGHINDETAVTLGP